MRIVRSLHAVGVALFLALGCCVGLGGCGGGDSRASGTQVTVDEQEQKQIEQASEEFEKAQKAHRPHHGEY